MTGLLSENLTNCDSSPLTSKKCLYSTQHSSDCHFLVLCPSTLRHLLSNTVHKLSDLKPLILHSRFLKFQRSHMLIYGQDHSSERLLCRTHSIF